MAANRGELQDLATPRLDLVGGSRLHGFLIIMHFPCHEYMAKYFVRRKICGPS